LVEYYRAIGDATDLGLLIYNGSRSWIDFRIRARRMKDFLNNRLLNGRSKE
jgi:hypothetical protein